MAKRDGGNWKTRKGKGQNKVYGLVREGMDETVDKVWQGEMRGRWIGTHTIYILRASKNFSLRG